MSRKAVTPASRRPKILYASMWKISAVCGKNLYPFSAPERHVARPINVLYPVKPSFITGLLSEAKTSMQDYASGRCYPIIKIPSEPKLYESCIFGPNFYTQDTVLRRRIYLWNLESFRILTVERVLLRTTRSKGLFRA